LLTHKSI